MNFETFKFYLIYLTTDMWPKLSWMKHPHTKCQEYELSQVSMIDLKIIFVCLSYLSDTCPSSKKFESCSKYKHFLQYRMKHLSGAKRCITELWQTSKICLLVISLTDSELIWFLSKFASKFNPVGAPTPFPWLGICMIAHSVDRAITKLRLLVDPHTTPRHSPQWHSALLTYLRHSA